MSDIVEATERLLSHKELAVLELLAPFHYPVLVAGAYHGDTIRALLAIDPAIQVYAFEPQAHCQESLARLAGEYPWVRIFPLALGTSDSVVPLYGPGSDFSSLVNTDRKRLGVESVVMFEAGRFLNSLGVSRWSLFLLNMEAYEYVLLPYLTETGVLDTVDNLLMQHHPEMRAGQGEMGDAEGRIALSAPWVSVWDRFPAWVWWSRQWRNAEC